MPVLESAQEGTTTYAYDAVVARSTDGGATWKRLGTLHRDGTQTEHGFVSFAPDAGGVRAIWLDGRASAAHEDGATALRTFGLDGTVIVALGGGSPMDAAKAAALSFVSSLPTATTVAVVGFGSRPYVVTPMTKDVGALSRAIARLRAQGETALYDALNLDGGGSTTLAMADPVSGAAYLMNVPSAPARGRSVASSLAVFALPAW